jgi:hypothetical protein
MATDIGTSQPILEEAFFPTAGNTTTKGRALDDRGNQITAAGVRAAALGGDSLTATDTNTGHGLPGLTLGSGPAEAAGTWLIGDELATTTSGAFKKAVPGDWVVAIAREDATVIGQRRRIYWLAGGGYRKEGLAANIGAALAVSSNAVAPTNKVHHVGAGLIKNITVPAGGLAPGERVTFWPDAAFTYDATGNVLLPTGGGTAVVNRPMDFIFDPNGGGAGVPKFAPSY